MIDGHLGLCVSLNNGEEMLSSPQIMTLSLDVTEWRLAKLCAELGLLLPNPSEPCRCVRASHVDSRVHRRHQCDVSGRRMHREMDVLHGLPGQLNLYVRELDRRGHVQ